MKLISWNVNGLRACLTKGFMDAFDHLDADIFCLQETKLSEGQLELELPGYYQFWNYAEKKGYSGTAVFTKEEPVCVSYGIGILEHDHEGRVITLNMKFYLSQFIRPIPETGWRLDYRMEWEKHFWPILKSWRRKSRRSFAEI
ncbi:MAG: exodeoxyribonuclease III [Blautia sp.]